MTTMTSKLDKLKSDVFKAAEDGDINELRRLIEGEQEDNIAEVVSSKTDGTTPLIAACSGHLKVVEYLVDVCGADIEQMGTWGDPVSSDPDEDVITPLWCAAAEGKLEIVKFLISRGADVNNIYKTCTPLMIACEMSVHDNDKSVIEYLIDKKANINMPDEHGDTCLMIACSDAHYDLFKYLIDRGADINMKDRNGDTALHKCVQFFSDAYGDAGFIESMMAIIKLLVECKAKMEKNANVWTPLVYAAVKGEAEIVEYLITLDDIQRTEKIDALELLGATYVEKNEMTSARRYWKLAMEERFRDGFDVIQKPVNQEPNAAYENTVEVKSLDELDGLMYVDVMQMQALVVRERILGPAHWFTRSCIMKCGSAYADRGSLDKCLLLWTYALDLQQRFLQPLHFEVKDTLIDFASLFSSMMTQDLQNVEFDIIMSILKRSVSELERSKNTDLEMMTPCDFCLINFEIDASCDRILIITLVIIGLMCRIQERFSVKQDFQFKQTVYKYLKLNLRASNGYTPLHLACAGETSDVWNVKIRDLVFPSVDVAEILVEVGASVDARDNDYGNTPLHVAKSNLLLKEDLIKILLANEAHADACNFEGETAMDLSYQKDDKIVAPIALKYQTLQCLAARVIVAKDIVSKDMKEFVAMH